MFQNISLLPPDRWLSKAKWSLGSLNLCDTNYRAWTACRRTPFLGLSAYNRNSPKLSNGYKYIVAARPLLSLADLHTHIMLRLMP